MPFHGNSFKKAPASLLLQKHFLNTKDIRFIKEISDSAGFCGWAIFFRNRPRIFTNKRMTLLQKGYCTAKHAKNAKEISENSWNSVLIKSMLQKPLPRRHEDTEKNKGENSVTLCLRGSKMCNMELTKTKFVEFAAKDFKLRKSCLQKDA
jgi:hypothetical protein